MRPPKGTWIGHVPRHCDVCEGSITAEFYDVFSLFYRWAIMCPDCFRRTDARVGCGRGQHYLQRPDGTFHKVEG